MGEERDLVLNQLPLCLISFGISFLIMILFSPVPDYVKATVETVLKIHETEDDGDVLAFLTGQVGLPDQLYN